MSLDPEDFADDGYDGWSEPQTDIRHTPEFSRAAAAAISSPYFDGDDSLAGPALAADWAAKDARRARFRDAVEQAVDYGHLPAWAQAEYDLAMEAIEAANDTTLDDRLYGEIGVGNLVPLPPGYEPLPLRDVGDEDEEPTDDQG